jgi:hypothetical protein
MTAIRPPVKKRCRQRLMVLLLVNRDHRRRPIPDSNPAGADRCAKNRPTCAAVFCPNSMPGRPFQRDLGRCANKSVGKPEAPARSFTTLFAACRTEQVGNCWIVWPVAKFCLTAGSVSDARTPQRTVAYASGSEMRRCETIATGQMSALTTDASNFAQICKMP